MNLPLLVDTVVEPLAVPVGPPPEAEADEAEVGRGRHLEAGVGGHFLNIRVKNSIFKANQYKCRHFIFKECFVTFCPCVARFEELFFTKQGKQCWSNSST